MTLRQLIRAIFALALTICLLAIPVLASEEGGEDPVNSNVGMAFRIINFLIVAYGFWFLFAKKLPGAFRARADEVSSLITSAAKAKQEAANLLRKAARKLDQLDLEIGVMRERAQRDAQAEAERIRAAAQEEASKIQSAAELEVQAAERSARMELRALAAQLAVERAEALVRGKMTPATDAAIFQAFVSDLGRSAN
jgi:F-type H+-transporting ATPase subunit b